MEDKNEAIRLHTAGAIIRHKSAFNDLKVYKYEKEIDQSFLEEWVIPFYFNLAKTEEKWINRFAEIVPKITDEIILKNLGNFNWRTRSTGAFFSALKDKKEFIDIIGNHLLKSEVCYAGKTYAKTLAYFNDEIGNNYLERYLDYYLKETSLFFDQVAVFRSIKYLDKKNSTKKIKKYLKDWEEFSMKQECEKEVSIDCLEKEIEAIEKIKNLVF